jgi:hypothetical protein
VILIVVVIILSSNHCVSSSTSCYSGNREWPKDAAICTDNIAYICNAGGTRENRRLW